MGVSNPAIIRRHVVFPEPDGPSIEKNSPRRTSRFTPSTAATSPKRFTTDSSRTATSSPCGALTSAVLTADSATTVPLEDLGAKTWAGWHILNGKASGGNTACRTTHAAGSAVPASASTELFRAWSACASPPVSVPTIPGPS